MGTSSTEKGGTSLQKGELIKRRNNNEESIVSNIRECTMLSYRYTEQKALRRIGLPISLSSPQLEGPKIERGETDTLEPVV